MSCFQLLYGKYRICTDLVCISDQFVRDNLSSIERFTTLIVLPVGQVFGINPRSLHIFHDLTGPLIAFNRSGSIFINHRFYLLWHDEMVKKGDLNEALISVYHTLAHEIAHNLVGPHNSEHSFYFSTLCEKYFLVSFFFLEEKFRLFPLEIH